jgi:hypothetical protein
LATKYEKLLAKGVSLANLEKIPGTAGRWKDKTTGETYSRRDYLLLQRGGVTPEAYAAGRNQRNARYNSIVRDFKQMERRRGVKEKDIKIRGNSESAKRFKEIQRKLKVKTKGLTGAEYERVMLEKEEALEELGRRLPEWFWPVGESPT